MPRSGPNIALAVLALFAVVTANALVFDGALGHWLAGASGRVLSPLTQRLAWVKGYTSALVGRFDLARERLHIEQQQQQFDAARVQMDQLKDEVAFYRSAAGLQVAAGLEPIRGGAFSWPTDGGERELVINRGSDDNVSAGDAVVTSYGALIGMVRDVYSDHAVAVALGDPGLEVTARIADTDISGLVRTDRDGLVLDLVQKGETVTEGQIVMTGGNDRMPPGLVIGTVRSVDHEAATLFVPVRVAPAVSLPYAGALLIIRKP